MPFLTRPPRPVLAPAAPPARAPGVADACAATHVGRVRRANQDARVVDAARGLFALADGMGGHPAGDVASRVAVRAAWEHLAARRDLRRADLAAAVHAAQAALRTVAAVHPATRGMGTTLDVAAVDHDALLLAHAGDARVYRLRGGQLRRLTVDALERAPTSLGPPAVPTVGALRTYGGDVYLMATDGLAAAVPEGRVAEVLRAYGQHDLRSACNALVRAALAGGAPDNVTVLLFRT